MKISQRMENKLMSLGNSNRNWRTAGGPVKNMAASFLPAVTHVSFHCWNVPRSFTAMIIRVTIKKCRKRNTRKAGWYFVVVFIYVSLMIGDIEYLFICLLAISVSPLEKLLFESFARLKNMEDIMNLHVILTQDPC